MRDYLVFETDHFTVSQAKAYRVPGYLIVESKANRTRVAGFTPGQAADLLKCLADAETLVQAIVKPERVYILKFGEAKPRVHFHVFPRTARLARAYLAHVPDRKPYSGARIVDWTWRNHESIGFTDRQIRAFIDKARRIVRQRNKR